MADYEVLGYQARDEGANVAFYDDGTQLFVIHAASAAHQSQREDLIKVYIAGSQGAWERGREDLQYLLRDLLNAAPLEP